MRLTERFLIHDPPEPVEVTDAIKTIDGALDDAIVRIPELGATPSGSRLIGLAGTVSTLMTLELGLADYDRDRIHHAVLSQEAVARWCQVLGAESTAQRMARPGMVEGRQDVIFGGALVLRAVMARLHATDCLVSESDILDGLAMSLSAGEGAGS